MEVDSWLAERKMPKRMRTKIRAYFTEVRRCPSCARVGAGALPACRQSLAWPKRLESCSGVSGSRSYSGQLPHCPE